MEEERLLRLLHDRLQSALPNYECFPRIKCYLYDAARVAHVPGVSMRRAQWLGQVEDAVTLLRAFRGQQTISSPAWDIHIPYDYVTFLCEKMPMVGGSARHHRLEPSWSWQRHCENECRPMKGYNCDDTVVAVAALGDLPLLSTLMENIFQVEGGVLSTLMENIFQVEGGVDVDATQMMEVACANGHWDVAKWLCESATWPTRAQSASTDDVKTFMQNGARRALKKMAVKRDDKALQAMKEVADLLGMASEYDPLVLEATQNLGKEQGISTRGHPVPQCQSVKVANKQTRHNDMAVEVEVLTNPLLMARIGMYQRDSSEVVKAFQEQSQLYCAISREGRAEVQSISVLPRVAIIEGNLDALKHIHRMYRRNREPGQMAHTYNFNRAMHFAAMEGQLEILKWLHTLPGTEHNCRPDTMAMAVRCGWPEIVEWLHFHCPESAQTMSVHCVNDAAYRGHMDVLRICHKYDLGEITSATMEQAARAGRLGVLQYLCSIRGDVSTSPAMDRAIRHSQVQVVEWLHKNCDQAIDSKRIALALYCDSMMEFIWSVVDINGELVVQYALTHFVQLCATGSKKAVTVFLPLIVAHAQQNKDANHLLHHGFRAAIANNQSAIVQLLLVPFLATTSNTTGHSDDVNRMLGEALRLAVPRDSLDLVRSLIESGRIASSDLDALFRKIAAPDYRGGSRAVTINMLLDLGVDFHCKDAYSILAQGKWATKQKRTHPRLIAMKKVFPRRTQASAVAALRVATHPSAFRFMLKREDTFYSERIIMDNAPPCFMPLLVRYLIRRGRAADTDATIKMRYFFEKGYCNGLLTIREIEMLCRRQDKDINALVAANCKVLVDDQLWMDAAREGNAAVVEYLCRHVSDHLCEEAAIQVALEIGNLTIIKLLFTMGSGGHTLRRDTIQMLTEAQHVEIVQFLLDHTQASDLEGDRSGSNTKLRTR